MDSIRLIVAGLWSLDVPPSLLIDQTRDERSGRADEEEQDDVDGSSQNHECSDRQASSEQADDERSKCLPCHEPPSR